LANSNRAVQNDLTDRSRRVSSGEGVDARYIDDAVRNLRRKFRRRPVSRRAAAR
jgi:hypothetical protein